MNTRVQSEDFLVGHPPECYGSTKLPSNQEAFGVFFHMHIKEKKTVRQAATETVCQRQDIWLGKARISVKPDQHSIKKLELLFQTWKELKRMINRKTPAQIEKVNLFRESLDDLLDISHADALTLIEIQEYRNLLLAQQEKGGEEYLGSKIHYWQER